MIAPFRSLFSQNAIVFHIVNGYIWYLKYDTAAFTAEQCDLCRGACALHFSDQILQFICPAAFRQLKGFAKLKETPSLEYKAAVNDRYC